MDILIRQVRRAQRRLMLQQFVGLLVWFWFAALLAAAVAIGVSKIWPTGIDASAWAACWIGGGLGLSTLAAVVCALARRKTRFDSALEIDRRFGLKERVSSTLALQHDELESSVGQALLSDAIGRVGRIDVGERFRLRLGRTAMLPLAPALLTFGLAFFLNEPTRENAAVAIPAEVSVDHVKKAAEALEKKLAQRPKLTDEIELEDAKLLNELQKGVGQLKEKKVDQKQALVKLNDLTKQLEKRRDQLANDDKVKQQLKQLKDFDKGPAEKLGQALKNGDFGKALEELKQLKEKLANQKLDEKQKQELAKQLEQMQDRLGKMADAHRAAQKELQQQIERAKQAGQQAQAEKLQEQLDQLQQQQKQMNQAAQMANQLGNCAKCMKNGDAKGAQAAMGQLSKSLGQMKQEGDALQMLDAALAQVGECKNSMACKECNGAGCKACQGGAFANPNGKPGNGLNGGGRGIGPRPEHPNDTRTYVSQVAQTVGKGAAKMEGYVDGPSRKGDVTEAIKEQFESAKHESADPLTGQRLPHDYREHARKYFENLRDSQK